MSSKQNGPADDIEAATGEGRLENVGGLVAQGPEAMAFLQRQCTSDLRLLDVDGASQWSALLSAKGRVLFLFRILRVTADHFLLMAPGASGDELQAELRRYLFRSKLSLDANPAPMTASIGVPPPAGAPWRGWDAGRWVAPDHAAGPRLLDPEWQHVDTLRGIPQLVTALRDRFTPHMLSLQRLQAFSLKKGCYPGQEIVARTHYLGQQKRELVVLEAGRTLQLSEPLLRDGKPAGEVIQVSQRIPCLALAVAATAPEAPEFELEGAGAARRLPDAGRD